MLFVSCFDFREYPIMPQQVIGRIICIAFGLYFIWHV